MKKITYKVKKADEYGLFHDSRGDVNRLAKVCNDLIDKVNQLIYEVETLKSKIPFK